MDREEDRSIEPREDSRRAKKIISVFDADGIPFVTAHNKFGAIPKTLQECLDLTDQYIFNINKAVKAKFYVGFLTKGKCFRYRINPTYKANRRYDNLPRYLNEVREHLVVKHNFTFDEEYEADDLVLSFKKQYSDKYNCCIISSDKDILGSTDISYNPRRAEYSYNNEYEILDNFWRSMISGDTIDGIKGIPGKGPAYYRDITEEYAGIGLHTIVLDSYIDHFGEYEGIKEFHKNYLSLKILDNVHIGEIKLNKVEKVLSE